MNETIKCDNGQKNKMFKTEKKIIQQIRLQKKKLKTLL